MMFCKTSHFSQKSICERVLFGKTVTSLQLNKKGHHHRCFGEYIFLCFIILKHLLAHALKNRSSSKFRKMYRKTPVPESLFDKVADHQACKFIKNRYQHRYFNVNFTKTFKATFLAELLRQYF